MADNRLDVQQIDEDGLVAAYASAGSGAGQLNVSDTYKINNDGRVILHFKKSGASDCIVTVDTPGSVNGLAIAQRTATVVASTGDVFMGPFPPAVYNQPGTSDFQFTLDQITGLTAAALRI